MTPALLCEMLADRLNGVESALARIRDGSDAEAAARALRGDLIDILSLVARDPGLDAAVDDLHVAALSMAGASRANASTWARQERIIERACTRVVERLEAAGFELAQAGQFAAAGATLRRH